jgi:hypothetical protein
LHFDGTGSDRAHLATCAPWSAAECSGSNSFCW